MTDNTQFQNYVTSSAFAMNLGSAAIQQLLNMHTYEEQLIKRGRSPWKYGYNLPTASLTNYLLRRGLIQFIAARWNSGEKQSGNSHLFCLTRAGVFAAKMLIEGGFKLTITTPYTSDYHMDWVINFNPLVNSQETVDNVALMWGLPSDRIGHITDVEPVFKIAARKVYAPHPSKANP